MAGEESEELVVELDGQKWIPKCKDDFVVCSDIVSLANSSHLRAYGAALGVCWRGKTGRPKASLAACGYNAGAFGGQVVNELAARGIPMADIVKAGIVCFEVVAQGFLSSEALKGASDFSEAAGGDSSGR